MVYDTTLTHPSIADYVDALVCLILLVVSDARRSVELYFLDTMSVLYVAYVVLLQSALE